MILSNQLIDFKNDKLILGDSLRYHIQPSSDLLVEQESLDFHQRIRKAYLRRALADSDRFMVVSVEKRDQMDIFNEVWGIVQGLLTRRS